MTAATLTISSRNYSSWSLRAALARQHMQVDVEHGLERGLAVVDGDVVAVGAQFRGAGGPPDALPDAE